MGLKVSQSAPGTEVAGAGQARNQTSDHRGAGQPVGRDVRPGRHIGAWRFVPVRGSVGEGNRRPGAGSRVRGSRLGSRPGRSRRCSRWSRVRGGIRLSRASAKIFAVPAGPRKNVAMRPFASSRSTESAGSVCRRCPGVMLGAGSANCRAGRSRAVHGISPPRGLQAPKSRVGATLELSLGPPSVGAEVVVEAARHWVPGPKAVRAECRPARRQPRNQVNSRRGTCRPPVSKLQNAGRCGPEVFTRMSLKQANRSAAATGFAAELGRRTVRDARSRSGLNSGSPGSGDQRQAGAGRAGLRCCRRAIASARFEQAPRRCLVPAGASGPPRAVAGPLPKHRSRLPSRWTTSPVRR